MKWYFDESEASKIGEWSCMLWIILGIVVCGLALGIGATSYYILRNKKKHMTTTSTIPCGTRITAE